MPGRLIGAMTVAALLAAPLAAEAPAVKQVQGELPANAGFEVPHFIAQLEDGDITLLDITLRPGSWPGLEGEDGTFLTAETCSFGMVDVAGRVSVPTGSNHLLMSVRPGPPERYAANGLSCEYTPSVDEGRPGGWASMRLTGCYLVREVSIPTARHLFLNPLPGDACGLHG